MAAAVLAASQHRAEDLRTYIVIKATSKQANQQAALQARRYATQMHAQAQRTVDHAVVSRHALPQPNDLLQSKVLLQHRLNVGLAVVRVARGVQQALLGDNQRPAAATAEAEM